MASATLHLDSGNPHWVPRTTNNDVSHIPGEDGLPVLGNTLKMLRDPTKFGMDMFHKYGPVYRNNAFGGANIALLGPEANELVLMNKDKLFSSEQGWGPVLNLLFPRGLMLMDFDHHRIDRRALGIAFKPEPMKSYAALMGDTIGTQTANWQGPVTFYPAIKQLTLDIAAGAFLGLPLGGEADKINEAFVDMVQASIGVVRRPLPFTKMGKGVKGREAIIAYFKPQIAERRRNENRQDMFSQFCRATREDGSLMSEDEVVDHMSFLMMAAHDTITSSATSLIWLLAKHPEWQEKLRQECLNVAPAGAVLTLEQLGSLTLTEYAFKEALRLIPPVPTMPRRALRDFEFGGYRIPKGSAVGISPSFVHFMEDYWPDPERFDPMRHSPDQVRERHKFAWVPFGGGAHMCLGLHFAYMQIKILIHRLLTTRQISVAEGYAPDWQLWPIPKPRDGLHVTMTPL